jgi:acetyl esterase/lipase
MAGHTLRAVAIGVGVALGLVAPPASQAALPPIGQQPQAATVAPVAAPISADPAGPVRGTVVLVHGGAWAGHDARGQRILMDDPGRLFVERGWRVVSVDYDEGVAGLNGVLSVVDSELKQPAGAGPLCLYGESAGAQLALVAASRRPAIDCVMGIGAPADLAQMEVDGDASADPDLRIAGDRIKRFFGTAAEQMAPWNPVALAPAMRVDVLLLHEIDDPLVSSSQAPRFQAALPTTQVVELEAGDPADPATKFRHGTVSDLGRTHYAAALGAFADQARLREDADRRAAGLHCPAAADNLADVGLTGMQSALRCLARRDADVRPTAAGAWRGTTINVRGQIDAGRIWARMLETAGGRRSLAALTARHARLSVRIGERSRVRLRCTRR